MPAVSADTVREIRSRLEMSQSAFATLLSKATDRNVTAGSISQWENGKRDVPDYAEIALLELDVADRLEPSEVPITEYPESPYEASERPEDSVPGMPEDAARVSVAQPMPMGSAMERAAIEMWQGIGGMVELAGAFVGGPKVIRVEGSNARLNVIELDGRTISGDSIALGKATAKLAAQNAWVSRILHSMTAGGAWVDFTVAVSQTSMRIYRNHEEYSEWVRSEQARRSSPSGPVDTEGTVADSEAAII